MKKYKLNKRKKVLSFLAASTVAINMLFLPPFLTEDEFSLPKKQNTIEQMKLIRKLKK